MCAVLPRPGGLHRNTEHLLFALVDAGEEPDVEGLLWPLGSACLDLETHYGDAIDALYPDEDGEGGRRGGLGERGCGEKLGGGEWGERGYEERLEEYLLMKDMVAVQKRGADAVSVTLISHDADEGELVRRLVAQGWEEAGDIWEGPTDCTLLT